MNIPYQNMEIEQIYTQLLSDPHTSIAICSAEAGEGVTSVAFALAQRNLLAGHSTLLVDLNLYRPALNSLLAIDSAPLINHPGSQSTTTQLESSTVLSAPQLICSEQVRVAVNGVVAPTKRQHIMKLRQPGVIEQCINEWLECYDTVIIDTSPLNRVNAQNIPAERVAAACDGALLTVLAGSTTESAIDSALSKLANANALLLGSVINDRDHPTLRDELLREVSRMVPHFSWLSTSLKNMINRNRLLTLEV